MKYEELKRRITEYLVRDVSEFKEKDDRGEGYFVTHLIGSSTIRAVLDISIDARRQRIEMAKTSDMRAAETVCFYICKELIDERYRECIGHTFPDGKIDVKTATEFLNYAFTTLGLDVTLDGRNVIDMYYRLNDSKKKDDTISILELHIPHGSSNGDVFNAVFRDIHPFVYDYDTRNFYGLGTALFSKSLWDAPYEGDEDNDR